VRPFFLVPTTSKRLLRRLCPRGDLVTYVALETFSIRFCMDTGNLEKDLQSGVCSFRLQGLKFLPRCSLFITATLSFVKWKKITLY